MSSKQCRDLAVELRLHGEDRPTYSAQARAAAAQLKILAVEMEMPAASVDEVAE
jgi:hypothetical protein